ncbi:hypothetical protein NQ315_005036 [Exocentrus adspersus]|uniref:Uncharacterized protein n=1 Tax=Exocentrus adspersus TaxID=1586481 RepID=A0AAV8VQV9_9CUCU|nr:hypothetical protein NQ315_005036 [Exocentrus adspersus]
MNLNSAPSQCSKWRILCLEYLRRIKEHSFYSTLMNASILVHGKLLISSPLQLTGTKDFMPKPPENYAVPQKVDRSILPFSTFGAQGTLLIPIKCRCVLSLQ